MLPQLLHRGERVLWRVLFRRCIVLPFNKPATYRVVFLFEKDLVPAHEHSPHGVRVREFALRRVEDNVLERDVYRFRTELHGKRLVRLVAQTIKKQWIDRCRFLSDQPGEGRTFSSVTLTGSTQAAV